MTAYAVPHPETLSVGIALTQYRSSMTSPCFSPTGPSLDALLPSAGSPRVEFPGFNGTIRALRLPAVRPAALRFLRLAVPPWHARFAPTGVACDAGDQGFLLFLLRLPLAGIQVETTGPLTFLGNPDCALALLFDPGRLVRTRPLRCNDAAPAMSTTKAPALWLSRLNHTASALAVYAPQDGLLHHHARLASGHWPSSTGRA